MCVCVCVWPGRKLRKAVEFHSVAPQDPDKTDSGVSAVVPLWVHLARQSPLRSFFVVPKNPDKADSDGMRVAQTKSTPLEWGVAQKLKFLSQTKSTPDIAAGQISRQNQLQHPLVRGRGIVRTHSSRGALFIKMKERCSKAGL